MKNLLTSAQMRLADAFTIKSQQISPVELMETASAAFVHAFIDEVQDKTAAIAVLCGKGNNGADGLAIARLLKDKGYTGITVYLIEFSATSTAEYQINLDRLKQTLINLHEVSAPVQLAALQEQVIIDAILGSGLSRPLAGLYQEMAGIINALKRRVIAVDIPTGFPAEGATDTQGVYLKAELVISFQRPKINFFFPESAAAFNRFQIVDIGLSEEFIQNTTSAYQLMDANTLTNLVQPRKAFTHKGTYGHALLIAGQKETMGAALLAAKACLHGGAGLTTVSIPESGLTALNTALPEVMYIDRNRISIVGELEKFKVVATGPGLGTAEESINLVQYLLNLKRPLLLDADALNILGSHPEMLEQLCAGSVLTPHMKEFDHLFGTHQSWWARLQTARQKAIAKGWTIVLKNQYTFIIDEMGQVTINSTGNPAMAQGGMGDVLTGLTASFLAQGHTGGNAAIIACYLHGKAGDELAENYINVTASQVAERIPETLKGLNRDSA